MNAIEVSKTGRPFGRGVLARVRRILAIAVVAASAVAALAIPSQGAALTGKSQGTPASGTVAVTNRQILLSYRDERDVVQERFVHRQLAGTFAGTEVAVVHYVIHPDGSATVTAINTCTCTVEGRTGTVTFADKGTVSAAGVISTTRKSIDATDGLAGLRAELKITGNVKEPTQTYAGHYEFGDEE